MAEGDANAAIQLLWTAEQPPFPACGQ